MIATTLLMGSGYRRPFNLLLCKIDFTLDLWRFRTDGTEDVRGDRSIAEGMSGMPLLYGERTRSPSFRARGLQLRPNAAPLPAHFE